MSHTVTVFMIADQEIEINGRRVNTYDIDSIIVSADGVITDAFVKTRDFGWLSKEEII